jgi:SAM-dependent methyltransferase
MTASSRAHSFNAAADQYAASRPSYPPALFDFIEQFTSRPLSGARVVDVGAGTGIATVLLRERGADVIGVEPGEAMAAQFQAVLPGVPIVRGDGNALPLADASHDLITYAQSWQWTDTTRSVPEALRVLVPGGALAIWWNTTAFDVPWIRGQHERIAHHCGLKPSSRSRPDDGDAIRLAGLSGLRVAPPAAVEPSGLPRHAPCQHRQPLGVPCSSRGRQACLLRRRAQATARDVPRRGGGRDLRS